MRRRSLLRPHLRLFRRRRRLLPHCPRRVFSGRRPVAVPRARGQNLRLEIRALRVQGRRRYQVHRTPGHGPRLRSLRERRRCKDRGSGAGKVVRSSCAFEISVGRFEKGTALQIVGEGPHLDTMLRMN